jgi:hypothetical protein
MKLSKVMFFALVVILLATGAIVVVKMGNSGFLVAPQSAHRNAAGTPAETTGGSAAPTETPMSQSPQNDSVSRPTEARASATPTSTRNRSPSYSTRKAIANFNRWFADENPASRSSPAMLLRDHFQNQPVDPAWAPPEAANIEEFFGDNNTALNTDVHILGVECRSNMCEILAVQPDSLAGDPSGTDFASALSRVGVQPWYGGGFSDIEAAFKSAGDGQQMILVYFVRAPSPGGQ